MKILKFAVDVGRNDNIAIKILQFLLVFARVLHFFSQSTFSNLLINILIAKIPLRKITVKNQKSF